MSDKKEVLEPRLENYLGNMNDKQRLIFDKVLKLKSDKSMHDDIMFKAVFEWGILFGREGR